MMSRHCLLIAVADELVAHRVELDAMSDDTQRHATISIEFSLLAIYYIYIHIYRLYLSIYMITNSAQIYE